MRTTHIAELAARTPVTRERYVDLLRAFSIGVVVLGHWLMAVVTIDGGRWSAENALALVPGLWLATWVLQVMPLFFFVGGFSNMVAVDSMRRRGEGYASYLTGRTRRLLAPTAVFIGIWVGVAAILDVAQVRVMEPALAVLAQPLWFLGIYLIVVALAPAMIRLHRRYGVAVLPALAGAALAVDVVSRASGLDTLGYLNFAIVWLFAHQLGFFYADGTFARCARRMFALMAGGGLLTIVALTLTGLYPGSMVGLPGQRSNMHPPTVVIVALTLWLVGLAMLARPAVTAWLGRARVWSAVIAVNGVIMTAFLWHLTAMLIGVMVLVPLGFPQPEPGSGAWWLVRQVWIVALLVILAGLIKVFGRFERPAPAPAAASPGSGARRATAGLACVALGMSGFAVRGFNDVAGETATLIVLPVNPLVCVALLAAGAALLRWAVRPAARR